MQHLSKKYRKKIAVDDISFTVPTGKVVGFLGPNGAGKSTTMRLMLGLDRGQGDTTFDGKHLDEYADPTEVVGVLLEAKAFHPTRTARNHLRILAAAANLPDERVDEVLELVGLGDVAHKKPKTFSLGMSQRLGLAAALLSNPKYLLLDEPANGLDPEGIAWLRSFLRRYAADGHGVLISSHLLGEIDQLADNVVVIGRGKLIANMPMQKFISKYGKNDVYVRATNLRALKKALKTAKLNFTEVNEGLAVMDASPEKIGKAAAKEGVTIIELTARSGSLEDAFLQLTEDSGEYIARKGDDK